MMIGMRTGIGGVAQRHATPEWSLFTAADATAQAVWTVDPAAYELGTRFVPAVDVQVTALRYWRDASDVSVADRKLNLWNAAGTRLGTVTIPAGAAGWNTGVLSTPVSLTASAAYVVSYGTAANYVVTSTLFTSDWTSADGNLTAPADTGGAPNGAFNTTQDTFPNQSFNQTCYWVDVVVNPA